MEIHTVYFPGAPGKADFAKLLRVFRASFSDHMPDVPIVCHELEPCATDRHHIYGMSSNTHKLAKWNEIVQNASDDVVLCDCDLMAAGRIDDAWRLEGGNWDAAYTKRESQFPFNNGVMFFRNTPAARQIMARWLQVNNEMYDDPRKHRPYRRLYAGMNQAAWGYLLTQEKGIGKIAALSSRYNACEREWRRTPERHDIRIYHIKSALRIACLARHRANRAPNWQHIIQKFMHYESQPCATSLS